MALNDQEADIRRQALVEANRSRQPDPAPATASSQSDLYLEERTAELTAAHPYCAEITSPDDWEFLARKAGEQLVAEGVELQDDARGRLLIRTRIAELTDTYGPVLTGKTLTPAAPQPSGDKPATQLSETAKARQQKLQQAANSPPDSTAIGAGGEVKHEMTDAEIMALTEEEYDALPLATKRRYDASIME